MDKQKKQSDVKTELEKCKNSFAYFYNNYTEVGRAHPLQPQFLNSVEALFNQCDNKLMIFSFRRRISLLLPFIKLKHMHERQTALR